MMMPLPMFIIMKKYVVMCNAHSLIIVYMYSCLGTISISPSPRAAVCNVGNELEISCDTTGNFTTWNVKLITGNRITRTLSTATRNSEVVMINSTTFTFSRTSELGSTGLMSKLVISSVRQCLNETNITCMEVGASAAKKAVTTVYIVGNASGRY